MPFALDDRGVIRAINVDRLVGTDVVSASAGRAPSCSCWCLRSTSAGCVRLIQAEQDRGRVTVREVTSRSLSYADQEPEPRSRRRWRGRLARRGAGRAHLRLRGRHRRGALRRPARRTPSPRTTRDTCSSPPHGISPTWLRHRRRRDSDGRRCAGRRDPVPAARRAPMRRSRRPTSTARCSRRAPLPGARTARPPSRCSRNSWSGPFDGEPRHSNCSAWAQERSGSRRTRRPNTVSSWFCPPRARPPSERARGCGR